MYYSRINGDKSGDYFPLRGQIIILQEPHSEFYSVLTFYGTWLTVITEDVINQSAIAHLNASLKI